MTVEINTDDLEVGVENLAEEEMQEAMGRWFETTEDTLLGAASQRAGIDAKRDQRGSLQGREDNALYAFVQSMQPPQPDGDGGLSFAVTHEAAVYHEWGTEPHEIEATDGVLAFRWPDAPDEVVDMFTSEDETRADWDGWVYFPSVQHPGTPAIGFMRAGRAAAAEYLRGDDR